MKLAHSFDRWMYRGKRPNYLARLANRTWAGFATAAFGPRRLVRLEVRGRRTGRTVSLPLVVTDYQGERYLVSMLGDGTIWVRNVRAADGLAVLRHGRRRGVVRLAEVEPGKRAPGWPTGVAPHPARTASPAAKTRTGKRFTMNIALTSYRLDSGKRATRLVR